MRCTQTKAQVNNEEGELELLEPNAFVMSEKARKTPVMLVTCPAGPPEALDVLAYIGNAPRHPKRSNKQGPRFLLTFILSFFLFIFQQKKQKAAPKHKYP